MAFDFPVSAQVEVQIPNDVIWKLYFLAVAIIITAILAGKLL